MTTMKKVFGVLLLVTLVLAEPPYPPSGWQPAGERLRLPIRNQKQQFAPVPHTVYGPPSTTTTQAPIEEQPANEYGPPPPQEEVPQQPEYGPPQQPEYGPPQQPEYGPPQEEVPQQPEYGPPQEEEVPEAGYGGPEEGYPESGGYPEYETPEGSGQLPVEQQGGASERLRQGQFRQQLPHFEPARFGPNKSQRLRQPNRQVPNRQQPLRQANRQVVNTQQPNRQQQPARFQQSQKLQQQQTFRQTQNFRQVEQSFDSHKPKAQLYTTTQKPAVKATRKARPVAPTTTEGPIPEDPNVVAIATAFSGRYYVLQNDGLLQEVTYKLDKNGKLQDGRITPNLKHENLAPIKEPIYTFSKNQQLIRIN